MILNVQTERLSLVMSRFKKEEEKSSSSHQRPKSLLGCKNDFFVCTEFRFPIEATQSSNVQQ